MVGPMTGRGRVPAPAPGRGGRGRAVLIRGGAELSAATNQRAGVGWLPNGGRGGAVAPPRGASLPRPRHLLRARPRASERSNQRTNPAKAGAERPDRGSKARRGRRKAAEHAPLSLLSTLGAARTAPGECAIGDGAPQLPGPSGGPRSRHACPRAAPRGHRSYSRPRLRLRPTRLREAVGYAGLLSVRVKLLFVDRQNDCVPGKGGCVFLGGGRGDDGAGQRRGGGGAPRPLSRAQKMTAWVAWSSHPFSTPKSLYI